MLFLFCDVPQNSQYMLTECTAEFETNIASGWRVDQILPVVRLKFVLSVCRLVSKRCHTISTLHRSSPVPGRTGLGALHYSAPSSHSLGVSSLPYTLGIARRPWAGCRGGMVVGSWGQGPSRAPKMAIWPIYLRGELAIKAAMDPGSPRTTPIHQPSFSGPRALCVFAVNLPSGLARFLLFTARDAALFALIRAPFAARCSLARYAKTSLHLPRRGFSSLHPRLRPAPGR